MSDQQKSDEVLDETDLTAIAEAIKPYPLSEQRKQSMHQRLFERINSSSPAPDGTKTIRAQEMQWREVLPEFHLTNG